MATITKAKREGKIFIDFFRNDYTATGIASYSLRARPRAPVAVPLEWRELTTLHSANQFDMGAVLKRIQQVPGAGSVRAAPAEGEGRKDANAWRQEKNSFRWKRSSSIGCLRGKHGGMNPNGMAFAAWLSSAMHTVTLLSKSGKPLERYFPDIVSRLEKLAVKTFILDGELLVEGEDGYSFSDLQLRLHPAASRVKMLAEKQPATFVIFDLLETEQGTTSCQHRCLNAARCSSTSGRSIVQKTKPSNCLHRRIP